MAATLDGDPRPLVPDDVVLFPRSLGFGRDGRLCRAANPTVAGTDSCQIRHVGIVQAGGMHVVHDDGTEEELGRLRERFRRLGWDRGPN
jgi:hypothetical protein